MKKLFSDAFISAIAMLEIYVIVGLLLHFAK